MGTARTVLTAIKDNVPVVLVRDSGGCARALADFVAHARDPSREVAYTSMDPEDKRVGGDGTRMNGDGSSHAERAARSRVMKRACDAR